VIVSKSGTINAMTNRQTKGSELHGIGGDPIIEQQQKKLELLMNDPETECIVMIGEIGGQLEADAAH
jgi:succinyl-CoA synthetase alpha subunit